MIKLEIFDSSKGELWNDFVLKAKNAHFIFHRNYMDYHSDRFDDRSIMFYKNEKLVAVLPANLKDETLYSHQGLTFGGIISGFDMTVILMSEIIDELILYMKNAGIEKLIYKHIPYIYYTLPSQEDFYLLFNKGAKLSRVDVSSTIDLSAPHRFSSRRQRGVKKALKSDLRSIKSNDFERFFELVNENLGKRHNAKSVHNFSEMKLLAERFPENISMYLAINNNNEIYAGVIIFSMNHWVHAQYIAASESGRDCGALDFLFNELINNIYKDYKFFDFGISTEQQGKVLNSGLINQKEEFFGRSITHNFLELEI